MTGSQLSTWWDTIRQARLFRVLAVYVGAVPRRWLTWRRAIIGGVLAFILLGVAVTGYMAMRVLGIGPVGSLVAAGVLDEHERVILADFQGDTQKAVHIPAS